jgi:uncharacterized protein
VVYLDASFVLATLFSEINTDRAAEWLASTDLDNLCSSRWLSAEVTSAVGVKVRTGTLSQTAAISVLTNYQSQFASVFEKLDVTRQAFETATTYLRQPDLSLKAGDALHVAVAAIGGHSLATFDIKMLKAAEKTGVAIEMI